MKKIVIAYIAIVTMLSVNVKAQGIYSTDGDTTFNFSTIHTVNINFSNPAFWDSLTAYHATGECYMGSVNIDGKNLDSVCFVLDGNASYTSMPTVKKTISMQFDYYKSQKFDGLKTLNLKNGYKDPTLMREKLMCDFLNAHNIVSPRATYANVYINGTLWGFYIMVEQVNKTFNTYHFNNNDGNLFKCDPNGNLKWKGALASSYYADYTLKTNTIANDWSDLVNLIDKINNSGTGFYDSVKTVLNTDLFIKSWAANNVFVNLDSYFNSGNNYYLYHDTIANKFQIIAWDMNESFGNAQNTMTLAQLKNLSVTYTNTPATSRPLVNNMLLNTTYKAEYLSTIYNWLTYDFSPAYYNPKIDSLANAIRTFVYADPNKQYTNANFDFNIDNDLGGIPGLKDFVLTRRTSLIQQLVALGYVGAGIVNQGDLPFTVGPNPAADFIAISNLNANKNYRINLTDLSGRVVSSKNVANQNEVKLERKDLANGIYILEINDHVQLPQQLKIVLQ